MPFPIDHDGSSVSSTGENTRPVFCVPVLRRRLRRHRPVAVVGRAVGRAVGAAGGILGVVGGAAGVGGRAVGAVGRAVGAVARRAVGVADRAVGPSVGVAAESAVVLVLPLALALLALSVFAAAVPVAAAVAATVLVSLSQGFIRRGYLHVGVDGGVDGEELDGFVDGLVLLLLRWELGGGRGGRGE